MFFSTLFSALILVVAISMYFRILRKSAYGIVQHEGVRLIYQAFILKILIGLMIIQLMNPYWGLKNTLIFIVGLVTMNSVFLIYRAYKI